MLKSILLVTALLGSVAFANDTAKNAKVKAEQRTALEKRQLRFESAITELKDRAAEQGFFFNPIKTMTSHSFLLTGISILSNERIYSVVATDKVCETIFHDDSFKTVKVQNRTTADTELSVIINGKEVTLNVSEEKQQDMMDIALCQSSYNLVD